MNAVMSGSSSAVDPSYDSLTGHRTAFESG